MARISKVSNKRVLIFEEVLGTEENGAFISGQRNRLPPSSEALVSNSCQKGMSGNLQQNDDVIETVFHIFFIKFTAH